MYLLGLFSYFPCTLFFCNFFSLLLFIMPNFSTDIFMQSWFVSFLHLLHPNFLYLKYLTDFEVIARLGVKSNYQGS